jgi:hypothetical protein
VAGSISATGGAPGDLERVFYGASMSQLSLFSAGARPPRLGDLAGLLCGPGQIVRFGAGDTARLSIVLPDPTRAAAVVEACTEVCVTVDVVVTESGATAVRTAFRHDLVDLARAWTRGAVKTVPAGMVLDGAVLRMWLMAAGRWDGRGVELLLDPHGPETHLPLVAAVTRAGLSPARSGRGAALRVSGIRRIRRFVELVGPPPATVPLDEWPGTGASRSASYAPDHPADGPSNVTQEIRRVRTKTGRGAADGDTGGRRDVEVSGSAQRPAVETRTRVGDGVGRT